MHDPPPPAPRPPKRQSAERRGTELRPGEGGAVLRHGAVELRAPRLPRGTRNRGNEAARRGKLATSHRPINPPPPPDPPGARGEFFAGNEARRFFRLPSNWWLRSVRGVPGVAPIHPQEKGFKSESGQTCGSETETTKAWESPG